MRVYLVRHPPVALDPGICYGASDVALADGWRDSLARTLAQIDAGDREGAAVFSSPLARCLAPARVLGRPVEADARLRELDFGAWELLAWDAISRAELDAWAAALETRAPPGGEALAALDARAADFLAALAERAPDAAIVFTHSGVIRCMLARFLGLAPERAFRIAVDFGSVTLAALDAGRATLRYVNR